MAGRSWGRYIEMARKLGYRVGIFYVILSDVSLALERVRERAKKGGHDIPEPVIIRRFARSKQMFGSVYHRAADQWTIFDNTNSTLKIVAGRSDTQLNVYDDNLFNHHFPAGLK